MKLVAIFTSVGTTRGQGIISAVVVVLVVVLLVVVVVTSTCLESLDIDKILSERDQQFPKIFVFTFFTIPLLSAVTFRDGARAQSTI